ncbi:hypothetical protein GCM10017621_31890 [Maricaulis virginensis]|uniref:Uncharacterized protein n=1 Tax=Maricaulis virginensis TaxID=144022 RepID=A0A9W6MQ77_9PROT|nr:hypothetical protein GCM10017621_31890 [Maricaulis virginensis]
MAIISAVKAGLGSDRLGASSASMKAGPSCGATASASAGQLSTIVRMTGKIVAPVAETMAAGSARRMTGRAKRLYLRP